MHVKNELLLFKSSMRLNTETIRSRLCFHLSSSFFFSFNKLHSSYFDFSRVVYVDILKGLFATWSACNCIFKSHNIIHFLIVQAGLRSFHILRHHLCSVRVTCFGGEFITMNFQRGELKTIVSLKCLNEHYNIESDYYFV